MMKQTVCLLFVLVLVAQICAIPDDKADAEAKTKEATEKVGAEEKDKADTADAKHAAKDASEAKDKAVGAADDAKDHAEKLAKGDHKNHAKDCHKPGTGGFPKLLRPLGDRPVSKALKKVEETGKKMADESVKAVTGFMKIFGL